MSAGALPVPNEPLPVRHTWRDVGIASVVSAILVVIAGVAMVVQPWFALERFHSEYLIPWVVGFEVTRFWGGWGAAIVVCFHLTALQHSGAFSSVPRAGNGAGRWSRTRIAAMAACGVPVLYFPVSLLALASAMVLVRVALGLSPGTFFHLLNVGDVGRGAVTAVVMGIVPFGWTFVGQRLFSSSLRGLGSKIFITWLCMLGLSFCFSLAASLLSPADAGVDLPILGARTLGSPSP